MAKYKIQTDGKQYRVMEKFLWWWFVVDKWSYGMRNSQYKCVPMIFNDIESARKWTERGHNKPIIPTWRDIDA